MKEDSYIIYQKSLSKDELEEIFKNAPIDPSIFASSKIIEKYNESKSIELNPSKTQRKIEGEW